MVGTILMLIIGIPIALLVGWNLLGLVWAIISDVAGLIFAIVVIFILFMIMGAF